MRTLAPRLLKKENVGDPLSHIEKYSNAAAKSLMKSRGKNETGKLLHFNTQPQIKPTNVPWLNAKDLKKDCCSSRRKPRTYSFLTQRGMVMHSMRVFIAPCDNEARKHTPFKFGSMYESF